MSWQVLHSPEGLRGCWSPTAECSVDMTGVKQTRLACMVAELFGDGLDNS